LKRTPGSFERTPGSVAGSVAILAQAESRSRPKLLRRNTWLPWLASSRQAATRAARTRGSPRCSGLRRRSGGRGSPLAFRPCRAPTRSRQAGGKPHAATRQVANIWSTRMFNLEAFAAVNAIIDSNAEPYARSGSTASIAPVLKRLQQLSVAIMFLRFGSGSVSSSVRQQTMRRRQPTGRPGTRPFAR